MIALAIGCALILALLSGVIVLFETQAMWSMDSPNARAWNATLNASATFGINIIPLFIVIIILVVAVGLMATARGFG